MSVSDLLSIAQILQPWPVQFSDYDIAEWEKKCMWYTIICRHSTTQIQKTVSPLHSNLQVANQNPCHQRQAWVKLQLALHLLLLTNLQLCHLPPPFPPAVSNSSCLFTWCQLLYASCCTTVLSKVLYYKIQNVFLIFLFFFNVLSVSKVL